MLILLIYSVIHPNIDYLNSLVVPGTELWVSCICLLPPAPYAWIVIESKEDELGIRLEQ